MWIFSSDSRLEKRKKFLDPVVDKRADRAKFLVTLRKKKRQEIFKQKRERIMKEHEVDSKSKEFIEFEAIVKEQIPSYDPDSTSFSDEFILNFAQWDLMSVFTKYANYKSSHFAKFLTKLTYTENLDYLSYILMPENKVIDYIEGLFSRLTKYQNSSNTPATESILWTLSATSELNAIKDVLFLCNNIAASPEFRNELLRTSYMNKINELVFYCQNQSMEIYRLISWSISVFTGNKIDEEWVKAFQSIENTEIDVSGLDEEDKISKIKEAIFVWVLSIVHIQLCCEDDTIKWDSLKAIINLWEFQDIGDLLVKNNLWKAGKFAHINLLYFSSRYLYSLD